MSSNKTNLSLRPLEKQIANEIIYDFKRSLVGIVKKEDSISKNSYYQLIKKHSDVFNYVQSEKVQKKIERMIKNKETRKKNFGSKELPKLKNRKKLTTWKKPDDNIFIKSDDFLKIICFLYPSFDICNPKESAEITDTHKYLSFYIKEIHCLDENDEDDDGDDIRIRKTWMDDLGNSTNIPELLKAGHFKKGKKIRYNELVKKFDISRPGIFPKGYATFLFMGEKDWGKFGKFVRRLWNLIKSKVREKMIELGIFVGGSLGALGAVIGGILGAVATEIIDFFAGISGDDEIGRKHYTVSIASNSSTFTGGKKSLEEKRYFKGSGAEYKVTTQWILHN